MSAPLGIVTCCYAGDYALVKAACASIRYYLPETPVCVIVDGDLDITPLAEKLNVSALYVRHMRDRDFAQRILQSPFAKFAAYVEGPFEQFVFIDSDVILWGNPLQGIDLERNDFVIMQNTPWPGAEETEETPETINHYYFDLAKMRSFDPEFDYRRHPFFSTGVFASRRDCFSKDDLIQAMDLRASQPGLFKFNDMPLINYMVSLRMRQNSIRYTVNHLQFLPAKFPLATLRERLPMSWRGGPPAQPTEALFLHYCGIKPYLYNLSLYQKPIAYFRADYVRRFTGSLLLGYLTIVMADTFRALRKVCKRVLRMRKS